MNTSKLAILVLSLSLGLIACDGGAKPSKKNVNARKAAKLAENIKYTVNWESANISRRQAMVGKAGLVGFVTLFAPNGAPFLYTDVVGKLTSGGKRLTKTWQLIGSAAGGYNVVKAPSNDGTNGSSAPYQYFWNSKGMYTQFNGVYIYTDQPQRLSVEPIVVNITNTNVAPAAVKGTK